MATIIDTPAYDGRATIHFNVGKHYYTVTVPELDKTVYQPGVTTIIGMMDKSGPLLWWATEQCELYGTQAIRNLEAQMKLNGGGELTTVSVEFMRKTLAEMKRNYRTVKQEAADIGAMVHDYLHTFLMWREFGGKQPEKPIVDTATGITSEMIEKANAAINAGLKFYTEHEVKPLTLESPVWSPTHGFIGTDDFIGMIDGEMVVADYKTSKRIYPSVWLQTAAYQMAYCEEHPKAKIKARVAINVGKDGTLDYQRRPSEFLEADFRCFLGLRDTYMWDRVHGYEPKSEIEVIGPLPEKRAKVVRNKKALAAAAK